VTAVTVSKNWISLFSASGLFIDIDVGKSPLPRKTAAVHGVNILRSDSSAGIIIAPGGHVILRSTQNKTIKTADHPFDFDQRHSSILHRGFERQT